MPRRRAWIILLILSLAISGCDGSRTQPIKTFRIRAQGQEEGCGFLLFNGSDVAPDIMFMFIAPRRLFENNEENRIEVRYPGEDKWIEWELDEKRVRCSADLRICAFVVDRLEMSGFEAAAASLILDMKRISGVDSNYLLDKLEIDESSRSDTIEDLRGALTELLVQHSTDR